MQPDRKAYAVFISYSTLDGHAASIIKQHLQSQGIGCWKAPEDILPGESWPQAILRALGNSHLMLLVWSSNATASPEVSKELTLAMRNSLTVFPVRIENIGAPGEWQYHLANTHWMDAFDGNLEDHLKTLTSNLVRILATKHDVVGGLNGPEDRQRAATPPLRKFTALAAKLEQVSATEDPQQEKCSGEWISAVSADNRVAKRATAGAFANSTEQAADSLENMAIAPFFRTPGNSPLRWFFYSLRHYAVFSGRSGRKEWWSFFFITSPLAIAFVAACYAAKETPSFAVATRLVILASAMALCGAALVVPAIALAVRRFRDTHLAFWWIPLLIVTGLVAATLVSPFAIAIFVVAPMLWLGVCPTQPPPESSSPRSGPPQIS